MPGNLDIYSFIPRIHMDIAGVDYPEGAFPSEWIRWVEENLSR
jgi:hypothetical protein